MHIEPSILIPIQVASKEFAIYFQHLEFCLQAVSTQTAKCEVIVIDYISCPEYAEKIKNVVSKFAFTYLRTENPDPIWARGRALNVGIKNSTGNFVLFVDSDCVMPTYYVQSHINHLKPDTFTYSKFYNTDPAVRKCGNFKDLMKQKTMIKPPLTNCESHQGILKDTLNIVGCFDDTYRGWGVEDNDIYLRLTRHGLVAQYVDCMLVHLYHPSWQELMRSAGKDDVQQQTLDRNRTRYKTFRKTGKK